MTLIPQEHTAVPAPAQVWAVADDATDYLDGARAELTNVEERMIQALRAEPGRRILDVGCGTGHDIRRLAAQVGPTGRAVGVDNSAALIEQSTKSGNGQVEFVFAEASDLPFPDGSFDATMCKRVVEHVPDQAKAVKELLRVTAPGGTVVVADPDHGMWAPDTSDIDLTRHIMAWWCDHIPHPWTGRRLPGLLAAAGATQVRVDLAPLVLTTLESADALTWIRKAAGMAKRTGAFSAAEIDPWHEELERRDAEGTFLMFGALSIVTAVVPR